MGWLVTLDGPSYIAVMQHAQDRALREKVYRAYLTRASEHSSASDAAQDNAPLIVSILSLRHEQASLLGYPSYSHLSMASKMATLPEVHTLLGDLLARSYDVAHAEHDQLQSYAGENVLLAPWDVPYYAERLKSEEYDFDDEIVRQYFALDNVLEGLFSVVARLFNVQIVERNPVELNAQIWDPAVRLFQVNNGETNAPVAYFYLDPYTRAAEKRGGAWMNEVCSRSRAMATDEDGCRLPIAHMVTNQSPPVLDAEGGVITPSLMTFRDCETLFHEAGHALQHMLTEVNDGHVSGIRGVEWDAVEQPSQFMEYWCYDSSTLQGMAKHWRTGESLPDDLAHKIKAAKNFRAASAMLRQLKFALSDLELHERLSTAEGEQEGVKSMSIEDVWEVDRAISEKTQVIASIPEDRFLCGFSHIFAGGYAAGYYSYKWAEVLSADGFEAFEEAGLQNEEAIKTLGARYAQTVLGMGGSRPASEVFELFKGRQPTADALLRHSDLLPETEADARIAAKL